MARHKHYMYDKFITKAIHTLNVANAILGIVFVINGLILCFSGTRAYWQSCYLSGNYVASNPHSNIGVITYLSIWAITQNYGMVANMDWLYCSMILSIGFLFGLISMAYVKLAVICLGMCLGYVIALILCFVGLGTVVTVSTAGFLAYCIIFVIVGVLFMFFQEGGALLGGTALVGAFSALVGIDVFLRTGFLEIILSDMTASCQVFVSAYDETIITISGAVPPSRYSCS